LAAQLGCDVVNTEASSSEDIVECLRRQDSAALIRAAAARYLHLPMAFKPIADSLMAEPLLPEDPWQTAERPRVPLIIGATRDEGVMLMLPFLQNETLFRRINDDFAREGPVLLFGAEPDQVCYYNIDYYLNSVFNPLIQLF
jgi:carboxylesterase type B